MLKVQVEEEEEVAVCLQEKLKKTSLTVASLEAALNMKASEKREMEAKNAGEHWTCVDSIAVSLSTNSETAAATPLRVMRNFQRSLNQ